MNTNGGGLSYCHPGMYGLFLLIEAVRQLRGECGARQVAAARGGDRARQWRRAVGAGDGDSRRAGDGVSRAAVAMPRLARNVRAGGRAAADL